MKYIMTDNSKEQEIDVIFNNLREYNLSYIELKMVKPLAIFVNDENDNVIGGISAETHGNWLYISKDFYVKLGYKEVFTLEEYPLTGKRHYFLKQFTNSVG